MADVLITYKTNADELKAAVQVVSEANQQISESAKKAGKDASTAFKETADAAKAAFASGEVKKALDSQIQGVDKLKAGLKQLYDEEVKILQAGDKQSQAYKKNQEEAAKLRVQLDLLNKETKVYSRETGAVEKAATSLKTQLKNLKAELSALESQGRENTKQFQQTALAAAKLEDQIGDTNERVRVLASDTFKFDAAVGAVQGLAASFAVAQGLAATFGAESEDLNKVIAKTQGAIAVLNGVQEIANLITGQSPAKLALQNLFMKDKVVVTTAAAAATTGLATAEEGAAVATLTTARSLNVLKLAIASTGIGLLVIGLVALYKAWEENQQAIANTKKAYDDMAESTRDLKRDTASLNKELLTANENLLVSQGKLSKAEAERRQATRAAYQEGFKELSDKVLQYNQFLIREKELNKVVLQRQQRLAQAQSEYDKQSNQRNLSFLNIAKSRLSEALKDEKKAADARIALQTEINNNVVKRRELLNTQIKQINLDEQKDNIDKANKREDIDKKVNKEIIEITLETKAKIAEINKLYANNRLQLDKDSIASQKTVLQAELAETKSALDLDFYTRKKAGEDIVLLTQEINEKRKKAEQDYADGIRAIDEKLTNDEEESIKEKEAYRDKWVAYRQKVKKKQAEEDKESDEKETARTKEETQKKIDLINKYSDAIASAYSAINDLSRQQTENRIADIQAQSDVQLAAINNSLETERQQQRERAALEFRTNRLINAEKTKQAKRDKALALFQVGVNTAEAVSKSIAESPQTFGLPFSAFAVAQGIIQAGIIASKPIPKFEKGGQVGGKRHSQGGTLIEAEEGEFITNRVQAGKHKSALEAMNKSSEAFRAYIDKHYVRPAVMNYVLSNKRSDSKISVNATLNSASMENTLNRMHKTMKKQAKQSLKTETRYAWHNN